MPPLAFYVLLLGLGAAAALAQSELPSGSQPAQQSPAQQGPKDLMVAPSPGEKTPEATPTKPASQAAGVAANVCAELVAFFDKKDAQPASKVDATKGAGSPPAPGAQTAGPGQTAPPMDQVQQRSGLSAPVPQDDKTTGATQVTREQAQRLAQSGDLRGCQGAAQQMRRAGVALPAGLLALAALREDLLVKSQPSAREKTPQP
jgi:hypothetical protein